jgi:hypothetical protein
MKEEIALKDKKKLRKQINVKFNNVGNADEKNNTAVISSSVRS